MCGLLRPKEEGRIAIVTNAGRTAVDVSNIGAKSIAGAGNRERGHRAHDRCGSCDAQFHMTLPGISRETAGSD